MYDLHATTLGWLVVLLGQPAEVFGKKRSQLRHGVFLEMHKHLMWLCAMDVVHVSRKLAWLYYDMLLRDVGCWVTLMSHEIWS